MWYKNYFYGWCWMLFESLGGEWYCGNVFLLVRNKLVEVENEYWMMEKMDGGVVCMVVVYEFVIVLFFFSFNSLIFF